MTSTEVDELLTSWNRLVRSLSRSAQRHIELTKELLRSREAGDLTDDDDDAICDELAALWRQTSPEERRFLDRWLSDLDSPAGRAVQLISDLRERVSELSHQKRVLACIADQRLAEIRGLEWQLTELHKVLDDEQRRVVELEKRVSEAQLALALTWTAVFPGMSLFKRSSGWPAKKEIDALNRRLEELLVKYAHKQPKRKRAKD